MDICPAYVSKRFKSWKANYSFNDSKRKRMSVSCSKKLSTLLRGISSKIMAILLHELSSFF